MPTIINRKRTATQAGLDINDKSQILDEKPKKMAITPTIPDKNENTNQKSIDEIFAESEQLLKLPKRA